MLYDPSTSLSLGSSDTEEPTKLTAGGNDIVGLSASASPFSFSSLHHGFDGLTGLTGQFSVGALSGFMGPTGFSSTSTRLATVSGQSATANASGLTAISGDAGIAQASAMANDGSLSHLDSQLVDLYLGNSPHTQAVQSPDAPLTMLHSAVTSDGKFVVVDVTAKDHDGAALLQQLTAIGLTEGSSFGSVVSGLLPVDQIGALGALANVSAAHESMFAANIGTVTTQADAAQHADTARMTFSVDGTGIKVGILSDSFNTSGNADTMAIDIANNDLPANTTVLQDYAGGTDEGRGMAQLVHDLAPGASIEFATAFTGQAGFANNIVALASNGAKIIVDDVSYYGELAFQDSVISQAVHQVVASGVAYFSSAANNGHEGWQGAWANGATTMIGGRAETLMQFAPGQDYLQFVAGSSEVIVLQWDQPGASAGGAGSASDLDLFVTDAVGNVILSSTTNNSGGDPVEVISASGGAGGTYYLRVGLHSGVAPGTIKLMALGNGSGVNLGTTASNQNDGTVYGHATAGVAVGAAGYSATPAFGIDPPTVESFSSTGPTSILFDTAGNRLATPELRAVPAITAADGGNTSFFGQR